MASEQAAARGVRAGMTLAAARALCPGLEDAEHTPLKDLRALEGLARWMMRFSPMVGIDHGRDEAFLPAVFLDVGGCERVFGGLPNLIEQADEAMRAMRLHARIAIAPTIGAAWAVASAGGENGRIVAEAQLRDALAPLPPAALRIGEDVAAALFHLGIATIGQLLELPREQLPARFGDVLLRRIDQSLGRLAEPLKTLAYQAPVEARMEFDGPVDSLEAIWQVFKDLIGRVMADLKQRGCGARKLELRLERAYGPAVEKTILLSRASRNARNVFDLMRCAMEGLEEEATKEDRKSQISDFKSRRRRGRSVLAGMRESAESNVPAGFIGVRLRVPVFERISEEQISLLAQEEHDGQVELESLLERLALRLGSEGVSQARLVESHVPEKAYGISDFKFQISEAATERRSDEATKGGLADLKFEIRDLKSDFQIENQKSKIKNHVRPLSLLSCPKEIAAMVSPSLDFDGRPIWIRHDDRVRQVTHAVGPERISGQWWEGHNKTRDYFAVEDEEGRRWWVFRVLETGKWYVHGEFT